MSGVKLHGTGIGVSGNGEVAVFASTFLFVALPAGVAAAWCFSGVETLGFLLLLELDWPT